MHRIDLRQNGNVGNRMIQYAFAERLSRILYPCEIINVDLPEWGLVSAPAQSRSFEAHIIVTDFDVKNLDDLVARIKEHDAVLVELRGFFQNITLLPNKAHLSDAVFPASNKFAGRFKSNQIIINVRAGEILGGVAWYPIVPVQFYTDLVKVTGLIPVFVGQVGPSLYVDELRKAFPDAEFIATGVPMDDFELVRSADNICIAVSTFSWLAAWLSNASNIFYPLHGCLHPHLTSCYVPVIAPTYLVPVDDPRYRFFLFPLTYGLEQSAVLAHYRKSGRTWREVPAGQVKFIADNAAFVSVERVAGGLNPIWYTHAHPDAALEIAEGWYQSPYDHYAAIGHRRGYQPRPPLETPTGPNVAIGKRATQSSLSQWSLAQTLDAEAEAAISGDFPPDFSFHTGIETNPWWLCDLGNLYMVEFINIYNRNSEHLHIRQRALPLLAERSLDGILYHKIELFDRYYDFGGRNVGPLPLQICAPDGLPMRFLRLTAMAAETCLHLSKVELYAFSDSFRNAGDITRLPPYPNIAIGSRATQSSLSEWSRGSLEDDAYRAISASPGLEYSFHTALEDRPWWSVDLLRSYRIYEVRLYNRQDHRAIAARLAQFQFQMSDDDRNWEPIYERQDIGAIGGVIDGPFIWQPHLPVSTRYFRVQLLTRGILHFNRIEIYGEPSGQAQSQIE